MYVKMCRFIDILNCLPRAVEMIVFELNRLYTFWQTEQNENIVAIYVQNIAFCLQNYDWKKLNSEN